MRLDGAIAANVLRLRSAGAGPPGVRGAGRIGSQQWSPARGSRGPCARKAHCACTGQAQGRAHAGGHVQAHTLRQPLDRSRCASQLPWLILGRFAFCSVLSLHPRTALTAT